MKEMSIIQINEHTLSKGMTAKNCVYVATRNTVGIVDSDGDFSECEFNLHDIKRGDKFARSGCGGLHESGSSYFKIGNEWARIPNRDVMHFANPILVKAPIDSVPDIEFM